MNDPLCQIIYFLFLRSNSFWFFDVSGRLAYLFGRLRLGMHQTGREASNATLGQELTVLCGFAKR